MKVLIVEDEKLAANNPEKMLSSIDMNIKWLSNNTVDLRFLDIHLADGLYFKIFEQIKIKPKI